IITMPRLSDTMTEGTVATWLKKVGDKVSEGDILAEIETDKATMEFESFYSGTLLHIGIQEGESAPVDSVLPIVGPEGADVSVVLATRRKHQAKKSKKKDTQSASEATKKEEQAKEESAKNNTGGMCASPSAKKIAEEKGIDLSQVKASGDHG